MFSPRVEPGQVSKKAATTTIYTSAIDAYSMEERSKPISINSNGRDVSSGVEPRREPGVNMETWEEFLQTTTFHGVKFMFDSGGSKSRKFLWCGCVIACIVLFGSQVGSRTADYLHYKSNVEIKVVYNTSVEFPSVTICNQNSFRMTEVFNRNLTELVRWIYSSNVHSSRGITEYSHILKNGSLVDFLNHTTHQMSDMIVECDWNGLACKSDWKIKFTEYGLCFQFNYDTYNIKRTVKPGAPYGLRLVLNIEQFEYDVGPHNDVGLKVLLHHQREQPLVGYYGFAVPPGKRTLVSVHNTQSETLGPPHGNCSHDAQPRSDCLLDCLSSRVSTACDCALPYFDGLNLSAFHPPMCDLGTFFECVKKVEDNTTGDECPCKVPCLVTSFSTELSYSDLSTVSYDRLWSGKPNEADRLLKTYIEARELAQKLTPRIQVADRHIFLDGVFSNYKNLVEAIEYSRGLLTSTSINGTPTFRDIWPAVYTDYSLLIDSYKAAQDRLAESDIETIDTELQDLFTKYWGQSLEAVLLDRYSYLMKLLNLNNAKLLWDASNGLVDMSNVSGMVEDVENILTSCNNVYDCSNSSQQLPPSCEILSSPETAYLVAGLREEDGLKVNVTDANMHITFVNFIDIIYNGTIQHERIVLSDEYVTCVSGLRNLSKVIVQHTQVNMTIQILNRFSWIITYLNCKRWSLIEDIIGLFQYLLDIGEKHVHVEYQDSCHHVIQTIQSEVKGGHVEVNRYNEVLEDEFNNHGDIRVGDAVDKADTVVDLYHNLSSNLFDVYLFYLNRKLNKTDLFATVVKTSYKSHIAVLSQVFRQFQARYLATLDPLNKIADHFKKLVDFLIKTTYLPALSTDIYEELQMITKAKEYLKSEIPENVKRMLTSYMKENITGTISFNANIDLFDLLDDMLVKAIRRLEWAEGQMVQQSDTLQQGMLTAAKRLQSFADGNQLDEIYYMSNYVHLDIFHKDLHYTQVVQQPQFGILSLLSEVGGFLGLLLGASILTVCEIVDYMIRLFIYRCLNAKNHRRVSRDSN